MNAHRLRPLFQRRNIFALVLALSSALVVLCGLSHGAAQESEVKEREVLDRIPKHLPVRVKIKKPERLKDAKNDDWLDDMEIEVTNTGTKPIYCLLISLRLPDVLHESGIMYGFSYKFGRNDLVDLGEPIHADDVPLRSGETVTLNPPANHVKGLRSAIKKGRTTNPKKLDFVFQVINFGDGTGFVGTNGTPLPRRRSLNDPRGGGSGSGRQTVSMADPPPRTFMDSACTSRPTTPPVSFLPAAFSRAELTVEPKPARDICCQTSRPECLWMKLGGQTCSPCGEIQRMQFPACSDPLATCSTIEYTVRTCEDSTGFEHYCEESNYGQPCDTATPTPTPTPEPTPTPTPAPSPCGNCEPNPSCYCEKFPGVEIYHWQCESCTDGPQVNVCQYPLSAGCPSGSYNDGADCCVCARTPAFIERCERNGGTYDPTVSCNCLGCDTCGGSPVLVDVAGDGFALTDAAGGVRFDLNGNGTRDRLSWTAAGADDAWLVLDRDGNGRIESGMEMFGDYTAQPESEAPNGFLALAAFDRPAGGGNADGVVDARDLIFSSLRLWRDENHDGVSQPAELHPLASLDVARLRLDYKESKRVDGHGNRFRYRAKVDDARGAKVNRWAWDVFLVGAP